MELKDEGEIKFSRNIPRKSKHGKINENNYKETIKSLHYKSHSSVVSYVLNTN